MNNKKAQANMQINVSFLANTQKLAKELNEIPNQLHLDNKITEQLGKGLNTSLQSLTTNLNKLFDGLSKPGLSAKQYTAIFDNTKLKIQDNIKDITTFGDRLEQAYRGMANTKARSELKKLEQDLQRIKDLMTNTKSANTWANNAKEDFKGNFGIDFDAARSYIESYRKSKKATKGRNVIPTATTQKWMDTNKFDIKTMNETLGYLSRVEKQENSIKAMKQEAYEITKKQNLEAAKQELISRIDKQKEATYYDSVYKSNEAALKNLIPLMQQADNIVENDMVPGFNSALIAGKQYADEMTQGMMTLRDVGAQFGLHFTIGTAVQYFKRLITEAFEFYKSLDSALNEIYVVSNLTSSAVQGLTNDFINMAKETGMALDDVTRSATLFYQQGLNTDEVMEMTEVTAQFAKVAGIDATDAADKLTAAVNGYCLAAEDASLVADKFNKVAAASAADIDELSTAFSKAAAQANQAGVSMDNYLAYIATMVEATREAPENIGTSLKTIFSRMQQVKEGGTTEDGETDVNAVETALKSVGIALRDTSGELRDLEEVFDELGPKWQSLDRNTQAYLGTIIAGTRQQSRFITLMQNWDRVLDLSEQSANSAGMQALMHAKAMDSITSKMQVFRATWQEFISNIGSSDIFKGIISGITKLLDLINSGQQPIALITAAFGLFAGKLKSVESFLGGKITKFFTDLSVGGNQEGIKAAQEKLFTARQELGIAIKNKQIATETKNVDQERIVELGRINAEKAKAVRLAKQELEEQKRINREQKFYSSVQAIGMGLTATGMAVSNKNENIGGAMTSAGTIMTGIGLFFTTSKIAGIITMLSGLYQLVDTAANWDEKKLEKLENSINDVNKSLQDYSVLQTGVKATESLLEKYDELRHKVVLTNAEQETLNDTIQQLADTYNIDTVSDEYGNLSININEVNDALEIEKQKAAEAREELIKLEEKTKADMTEGLFKVTDLQTYYDKLLKSNAGDYKGLLNGLQDNLNNESRAIANSTANNFNSNFKAALIEEMKENGQYYLSDSLVENLENLEDSINNTLTESDSWNVLYGEIAFLEENLNSLTFDEVQGHLNNFYNNYMKQTGMAIDEWNLLVDAINKTLFDNSSLIEFIQRVQTEAAKANGSYYRNDDNTGAIQRLEGRLETINKEQKAIIDKYEERVLKLSGQYIFDTDLNTLEGMKEMRDNLKTHSQNWNGTRAGAIEFAESKEEAEDLYKAYTKFVDLVEEEEAIQERINALYEERNNYIKKYAEEYGLTVEQAKAYLNATNQIAQSLSKASSETIAYLDNISNIYNFDDIKDNPKLTKEWGDLITDVINGANLDSTSTDAEKAERMVELLMGQRSTVSDELKDKLEEAIDEAYNALELPSGYTFSQIAEEVDSITDNLRTMNELVEKFNENGGLTLDEFTDLAKILDSINVENLYSISDLEGGINYVSMYTKALEDLDLALDENSGNFTMNGEALASLQAIQEAAAKSNILNMKNELVAKKTQVEAEIAYIDAQIEGAKTTMELMKGVSSAGIETNKVIEDANKSTNTSFSNAMTKLNEAYSTQVQNLNVWTQATLTDLSTATEAWGRYWKAVSGTEVNLDDLRRKAQETINGVKFEGIDTLGLNNYGDIIDKDEAAEIYNNMQVYINNLNSLKTKYQETLNAYNAEISLLDSLYNSDLSKLGLDTEELEEYIGQLREIYNILNRIQLLEHRLSTLDSYSEVAIGKEYGKYLKERLQYTEELSNQYEFLVTEQKKFTNGYRDFIENSAVGHVFDFDKFGQIIINFEEYEKLQNKAAKGDKSLMEQADEMYEKYTEMFEELQGYFDEYIDYLQKTIDLHQEVIDSYVKVENDAADAIQEIYQKILDTKLDAIDKEIDALNDLKDARDKANKSASDAKEISGLQTDIQRAMMDTSGASSVALLQAQDNLDEKLNEIAEDKYSEMLENIISQLEDEQDALQEEFDEMFENLEWLYSFLETNIMGDREKLEEIFTQTEQWATSNNLDRAQQLQDLDKDFYTYMSEIGGNKSIYDVWVRMEELKNATKELDEALRTRESKIGLEIAAAIQNGLGNGSSGGSGSGGSGSGGSRYPSGETTINPSGKNNGSYNFTKQTIQSTTSDGNKKGPYEKWIGKTVEIKGSGTLQVYDPDGSTVQYINNPPFYNPNVIIQDIGLIGNEYWARTNYKNGVWVRIKDLQQTGALWGGKKLTEYMQGGLADFTGPAWLDGTSQKPEAVLNALQTEHFIKFTNALDKMFSGVNTSSGASSISIENISFNVDSMSSVADGEKAFDAFVNKFKEIGNQKGIKINSFKNTL